MKSGWEVLNDEYDFQDIFEVLKYLDYACHIFIDENYINKTKHDGLCG